MNVNYTNDEYADMIFCYGKANGNSLAAKRLYSQTYPNRRCPNHQTFKNLFQRLKETGSVLKRGGPGRSKTVTVDTEERILEQVMDNPSTSVRQVASNADASSSTVNRIIKNNLLYPYHIQRVQALSAEDFQPRMNFCNTILQHVNRYPGFLSKILFTDEASFGRDGIFNFHNNHYYEYENPHAVIHSKHQHRFQALNVWAGILGRHVIGPVFLPRRLNGENYLNFLRNDLPNLLEDVPLIDRQNHWFMHDGAPAHYVRNVRELLNERFNGKWIGRGGPISWPARSPDLNPLDFCLWGWIKCLVYPTEINSEEELRQRIENAFEHVKQQVHANPGISLSLNRRIHTCIEMNGNHFEHLI